ncbi:hypothetical protein SEA_SHAGRAT_84 [Rhodococcus phage Shagrat]|nr:hypothetical protein SEA_SHAGRAT_84 [Rhodococcus phage Shagrat]
MPKLISDDGVKYGAVKGGEFVSNRAPKPLDPEHPVAKAYEKSWNDDVVLEIATSDPDTTVKLLRKHAANTGRGVRVQAKEGSVVFKAKERSERKGKEEAAE